MTTKPRCKQCNLVIGSQWQLWGGVKGCPASFSQVQQKRAGSTKKRAKT